MSKEVLKEEEKKNGTKGCLLLLFIGIIIFFIGKWWLTGEDMNIQTNYDGYQLEFVNKDNKHYQNVVVTLNDKYILNVGDFKAFDKGTVGILQFADKDGNRFKLDLKLLKIKFEGIDEDGKNVENEYIFK